MKEIGGYLGLERYEGHEFHGNALRLNCARNCLAYEIMANKIRKIYIPYFLCDSVKTVCDKYGVRTEFYHIDEDFNPILPENDFTEDWLYLVNYYGQLSNDKIFVILSSAKNVIIDNVQAFFQRPDFKKPTLYSCRKFFGVTDGAYLYTDSTTHESLDYDVSAGRMEYIFGRFEKSASEFYPQYVTNNKLFADEPVKRMSAITENFMRSFNYETIRKRRTENFVYLHGRLRNINKLRLTVPEGAFAYPLLVENGSEIRKKLQAEKIYVPTLWPDVFDVCCENDLEYQLAKDILPLPVDQRYGEEEMAYIAGRICELTDVGGIQNEC